MKKSFAIALVAIIAVAIGAYLVVVGDNDEPVLPTPTGEPVASDLSAFYEQQLQWSECGDDSDADRCTWVTVPVDYSDPSGDTLRLRVRFREPGSGQDGPALFINPGGPGASGVGYVEPFATQATERLTDTYGIVGFDPRGVGQSTPIECLSDEAFGDYVASDPDPDSPAEIQEFVAQIDKLGDACDANTGDLLGHVSTIEVARDLDVLRALFGEEKLDYYGASYGTRIGAVYAELFPENVGKLVLDGAVDPSLTGVELALGQAQGFEKALTSYVANCTESVVCPLDRGLQTIDSLIDGLDAEPLPTKGDRELTEALGFYGVAVTMYNRDFWPILTAALTSAIDDDNGTALLALADAYFQRQADGSYASNSGQVSYAVNCLDEPSDVTVDEAQGMLDTFVEAAPTFGRVFGWSVLGCAGWPAEPANPPLTIDAAGAGPIVVVGTTRDPATPYEWAQGLAKQLESGVLVTRVGDGHTAYSTDNQCIDDAIDDYLLGVDVPEDGLVCK